MATKKMHFVAYLCASPSWHHNGSWRHPLSDGAQALDPARYENIARIYERGLFDGLFFVDYQALLDSSRDEPSTIARHGAQMCLLDPIQLLSAMARVTKHIGLTATMSTSIYQPFHIARAFATLDHVSGGRAGWNIVTSFSDREARSYGQEIASKGDRYDHAEEVVEACTELWESWAPDALVMDREKGIFADAAKITYVDYQGETVKTEGPFTVPRPPQDRPVFMQAGASPRGRAFAARWAEVVFTLQHEKSVMQAFYKDMNERVVANGRQRGDLLVMPAIDVIVGETEAEARAIADEIDDLASLEVALKSMSLMIDIDLTALPLDTPLSDVTIGPKGVTGAFDNLKSFAKSASLTVGQAARLQATTYLVPRFVGTPGQIADRMQDLFESECCDGFIISPTLSPLASERFVDLVVPELQRRGLYRTAYEGTTFRENLRS
jgi:FMN-dependent oxidoreductase (nitrilotriacetate monooxygenase family)